MKVFTQKCLRRFNFISANEVLTKMKKFNGSKKTTVFSIATHSTIINYVSVNFKRVDVFIHALVLLQNFLEN